MTIKMLNTFTCIQLCTNTVENKNFKNVNKTKTFVVQ